MHRSPEVVAVAAVHVTAPAAGTQAIGAPPMPWPQLGVGLLKQLAAFSNELAASPGTPKCSSAWSIEVDRRRSSGVCCAHRPANTVTHIAHCRLPE